MECSSTSQSAKRELSSRNVFRGLNLFYLSRSGGVFSDGNRTTKEVNACCRALARQMRNFGALFGVV